jgi:5-dehydro-2-deoxygluconokinase
MDLSIFRRNRFLVLGRAGMDLYADPPGTRAESAGQFFATLGGSAANIAGGLCKLNSKAALITVVSADSVGRFVLNQLATYGVETSHCPVISGEWRTSLAVVETRTEDFQSVIYRNSAADFQLTEAMVKSITFDGAAALIVTGTALAMEPSRGATFLAIACAREVGVPVVLDVDYRPYSWSSAEEARGICRQAADLSAIVLGNDEEFSVLAGSTQNGRDLAQALADGADRITIYKMGAKGSVTFGAGEAFETGIFPAKPLKPVGSGDAFMAGLMAGLAQGLDLQTCVQHGSAAAAITVSGIGCAPAMPTRAELDAFLAQNAPTP